MWPILGGLRNTVRLPVVSVGNGVGNGLAVRMRWSGWTGGLVGSRFGAVAGGLNCRFGLMGVQRRRLVRTRGGPTM